jgi:uncharacterized protein (DUF302 family)
MSKFRCLLAALLMLTATATPATNGETETDTVVHYSVQGRFENVVEDVKNAIESRGLVIDHTSHVAKMLDRTGKDMGKTRKMYGNDEGWVFSFCSATLSRGTMEADPHNIVFCPYTIAVYTLLAPHLAEPSEVHVAYRRPQRPAASPASRASLQEVEELLDGIVREALNLKK